MADAPGEPRTDALGVIAYVAYVAIGGVLVFGFAWALKPAVEAQNQAACRPLSPELRDIEAPDFTVRDLAGQDVTLSDLRGRFVVLNFWATWCEPCIREWPQLDMLAQRFAGRDDVAVLAVSVDEEPEKIPEFLERMGLSDSGVTVLSDPSGTVPGTFGTSKLPDTYFVDERGRLVHAYVNVREWGAPVAFRCLDSMVGRAG